MPKHRLHSAYDYVRKHRKLTKIRDSSSSTSDTCSDNDLASIISDYSDSEQRESPVPSVNPSNGSCQQPSTSKFDSNFINQSLSSDPSSNEVCDEEIHDMPSSCNSTDPDDIQMDLETENQNNTPPLKEALRLWAVRNINTLRHNVITDLLLTLKPFEFGRKLPATASTLLHTKRTPSELIEVMDLKNGEFGQYAYFGIRKELEKRISPDTYDEEKIRVLVNVDGLPIHRNSKLQFWPLLMQVCHEKYINTPFVVALFSGPGKPISPNVYLKDFVPEAAELSANGIQIQGKLYSFEIAAFVCDTPARAYLKCVKSHVAFNSCERCTVQGKTIEHRRVFANADSEPRTIETFRNRTDPQHHLSNEISPLLDIPNFDVVKSVILDYMHLLCVGVMKSLLHKWTSGNRLCKIDKPAQNLLHQLLMSAETDIPKEFQRKKLDLSDLANWKATQYRFCILYCGALLFKHVLPAEKFKHFMLLFAACRILCGRKTAVPLVDTAAEYLKKFFILLPTFYGTESQVMNFHNLLHIADDVKHLGMPLSDFSTFPFENTLAMIKKLIRTPRLPLSQVCRRLSEVEVSAESVVKPHALISTCKKAKDSDQCTYRAAYREIYVKNMRINISHPDNIVLLQNSSIFEIQQIFASKRHVENISELLIKGRLMEVIGDGFDYPCNSQRLGVYELGDNHLTTDIFSI